ncbi:MAG TPA: 30S ribosomal protein S7 [Gammaproteobacteria bacterium]|jgi:small subunit ribosomal protein S7|nr:30S ribosomal protein S7 [Gammaproteobacteria bacterium]
MSRRTEAPKREILPDPKYGNVKLAKFINILMLDGKKSVAERVIYGALDVIKDKKAGDPLETLEAALENVSPAVEVKSRRVGGATYQVPVEVRPARRSALAMRWLIESARKRGEKSMMLKLAGELQDAAEKRGSAVKKRDDTHRMAEANKAFSHYRW